jgi:hypothetical protein
MQGQLVWKLQIFPYNHANLNLQSGRSRQIKILENLSNFSKPVWTPSKFGPNWKVILLPVFLIQILFQLRTYLQKKKFPYLLFYQITEFGTFQSNRRVVFVICKFGSVWKIEKPILSEPDQWIVQPILLRLTSVLKTPTKAHRSATRDTGPDATLWSNHSGEPSADRRRRGGPGPPPSLSSAYKNYQLVEASSPFVVSPSLR